MAAKLKQAVVEGAIVLQDVQIRWLIQRDMPEVLEIEEACFGEFRWTEEDFSSVLRQRNCIGMVAEHCPPIRPRKQRGQPPQIVGFMLYDLHKSALHLRNFAVAPHCQRQGIGSKMVRRVKDKLSLQWRSTLSLHVREQNLAAQLFFRSQGFWATDVIRQFFDNDEDAYLMEFELRPFL